MLRKTNDIKIHHIPESQMIDYNAVCDKVLHLDSYIRYVGLADHLGVLLAKSYRAGLVPLSQLSETEKYTTQAIQRTGAIQGGSKVGKLQYVIGKYENLVRATVPLVSDAHNKFYLMLSFDLGSNPLQVLEEKLLPELERLSKNL